MILRPATLQDAEMLLEWRNDELTRANSINSGIIGLKEHRHWLDGVLKHPQIVNPEINRAPIGTVRIYVEPDCSEMSWTVAPLERGKGYGKKMVAIAISLTKGVIIAKIKKHNAASIAIAESNGFKLAGINGDILIYRRMGNDC